MAKMWAGRAAGQLDQTADDFNSSLRFDSRMYREDITGSMAHAAMLGAQMSFVSLRRYMDLIRLRKGARLISVQVASIVTYRPCWQRSYREAAPPKEVMIRAIQGNRKCQLPP